MWLVLGLVAGVMVLGFLGTIIAAVFLFNSATKGITTASDKVVVAVIANDPTAVYEATSQNFKDSTTEEETATVVNQVSPYLTDGQKSVINTSVQKTSSGDTATVDYKIKNSQGTFYMRVQLEKDGDNWKVLNFETSKTAFESTDISE